MRDIVSLVISGILPVCHLLDRGLWPVPLDNAMDVPSSPYLDSRVPEDIRNSIVGWFKAGGTMIAINMDTLLAYLNSFDITYFMHTMDVIWHSEWRISLELYQVSYGYKFFFCKSCCRVSDLVSDLVLFPYPLRPLVKKRWKEKKKKRVKKKSGEPKDRLMW